MDNASNKWLTLIGVGIAGIMIAIDFTIVNTVLNDIQMTYAAQMNELQWVMTGFGITFASFLISMGRLGDLWGRRLLLYIGMFGFALSSLGAGIAFTINQLIVCRILQGLFGAVMFPCGMAITASSFPANEQGRALGIYGSLLGIGFVIGPVLGGVITSISNWRWIFLINLPVILVSFIICLFFVKESRIKEKIAIDWGGIIFITLALGSLVFGITQSEAFGWTSPWILIPLFLSIVFFAALYFNEKKVSVPLLPPALFLNESFLIGSAVYCVCIALVWPIIFFVPLFLEIVSGFNTMTTGLLLLPMTSMTVIAPALSGIMYDKEGPFATTMFAFGMSVLGLVLFLFFSADVSLPIIILAFLSIGVSWGVGNGIAIPLALASPENKENEGLVSGAAVTILNTFGVIALSVATALFHYVENKQIALQYTKVAAFVSGFHAVIILLLVITLIFFAGVFWMFKHKILSKKFKNGN